MKIRDLAYSVCKFANGSLALQCDTPELSLFIEQQYNALPGYIRIVFWSLYFWVHLRGKQSEQTLKKWKTSRFGVFREFIQYHQTLIAFYAYSLPEER